MDMETGENFPDRETGELPAIPNFNQETGESEFNCTRPILKPPRRPFRVPSTYAPTSNGAPKSPQCSKRVRRAHVAPAFIILILLFFVPAFGILISIIELVVHMWAHKRNKQLRHTDIYYRSPFHDLVCEFCRICIDEHSKRKITKLQDKKNDRFTKYSIEYVRRIVT